MSSQGIQGQDIIPLEIWNKYKSLFAKYLPGWQPNGVYNYNAAPSTQMAAVQLNKLLHSGSHTWINEGLDKLFKDFEKKIPCQTALNIDPGLEWAPWGGRDQATGLTVSRVC